jgi:hypothetical protein
MKDIQAIGAILGFLRILPSAPAAASHAPHPVRNNARRAESGDGGKTPSGISTLLAVALLQGGSSSDRRRN